MIFIKLHSGLGNQMFQYAFGKIHEKNHGVKVFFICEKEEFKLSGFEAVTYIDITNPLLSLLCRLIMKFKFRFFNFSSCLYEVKSDSIPNYALISGYFQSSSILEENKEYIKSLFKISSFPLLDKNVCTIHFRRGDYLTTIFSEINSHAVLSEDWYFDQIDYLFDHYLPKSVYCIGDDLDYLKEFCDKADLKINFKHQESIADFVQLMTSKFLIISNSSFAWWGAFLNIHEEPIVIAPKNWVGYHVKKEYPKGIMNKSFLWR